MAISPDRPCTIVVGLNERDAAWHDAWTIDLASGRRHLVFENRDGYRFQVFDHSLSLRLLRPRTSNGAAHRSTVTMPA